MQQRVGDGRAPALGAQGEHRDPSIEHLAASLRIIFYLYCAFSLLADLWLNPITYVLVGVIICLRRYLEGLPAALPARVRWGRPALAMAR